jgi:hypothetical protein
VLAFASGPGRERTGLLSLWGLAALGCLLGLAVQLPATGATGTRQQGLDLIRVLTAAALGVVLVLGPGLALRTAPARRRLDLGFVPLPGLALLALTGCLAWALAPQVSPRAICILVVIPVLAWLLVSILRAPPGSILDDEERHALLIVFGALGIAMARALWSLGPVGELSGGTSYRTMEVGDRSDSRLAFGVVQLVAHGTSPFGALARSYFQGYTFSDRGPLSGLASAPIVLLTGGHPPAGGGPSAWSPFDAQGFMSYRLAMMTFASTSFLALWTLTRHLAGARAARLALLLAATTPFLVHEIWFTWPKLLAASMVLLAALSLIDGHPLRAGLLVGIGYLVHPLALLSLPALGLVALWPLTGARWDRPQLRGAVLLLGGVAVALVGWRLVNGSHYTQSNFFSYLTEAGRTDALHRGLLRGLGAHPPPATLGAWLSDRAVSVANTLVPLRLFLLSANDQSINTAAQACFPFCTGGSPPVVHFFFQYWTTVPFGFGILFLPLLLQSLWRATRRWLWPVVVAVVVPFVVFALYWGDASTGLLREGLHTWVLTILVVVAAEQQRERFVWLRKAPIRMLLTLRSVEVLLVATLPTILTRHRLYAGQFQLTDIVAVLAMITLCGVLARAIWRERAPDDSSPLIT